MQNNFSTIVKSTLLIILTCALFLTVKAQNIAYNSPNLSFSQKVKFHQKYRKGLRMYRNGYINQAINNFLSAVNIKPEHFKLNMYLGYCYLQVNDAHNAINFLEIATKNDSLQAEAMMFLANAYQLNYNFEKAIDKYTIVKSKFPVKDCTLISNLNRRIEECRNGLELLIIPDSVLFIKMPDYINTKAPEYSAIITPDSSMMFFTSRRKSGLGGLKRFRDNDYFEDIYISANTDGIWQKPTNLKKINTRTNDGISGISRDGKNIFIYSDKNGGDIYIVNYHNNEFNKSKNYFSEINTKYFEGSASITSDGRKFYFVSNRPDNNLGERDIYCSLYNDSLKKWEKPQNLGNLINTKYDEISVYVSPDDNFLYFSSKGHNTMGGYDIFVSIKNDSNQWTKPYNLGYPVNTTKDDVFFRLHNDFGLYSNQTPGNVNNFDIVGARFYIVTNQDNIWTIIKEKEKAFREKYTTDLHNNDYMFSTDSLDIVNKNTPDTNLVVEIQPDSAIVTEFIIPTTDQVIEFEFGKSVLKATSHKSLDEIVEILRKSQDLKAVIGGHTDNIGSFEVNQRISEERAKAVGDYFIKQKISTKQIECIGFSFTKPIATNKTEEGRAKNRRVEFEIVKIKK